MRRRDLPVDVLLLVLFGDALFGTAEEKKLARDVFRAFIFAPVFVRNPASFRGAYPWFSHWDLLSIGAMIATVTHLQAVTGLGSWWGLLFAVSWGAISGTFEHFHSPYSPRNRGRK